MKNCLFLPFLMPLNKHQMGRGIRTGFFFSISTKCRSNFITHMVMNNLREEPEFILVLLLHISVLSPQCFSKYTVIYISISNSSGKAIYEVLHIPVLNFKGLMFDSIFTLSNSLLPSLCRVWITLVFFRSIRVESCSSLRAHLRKCRNQ